MQVSTPEQKAAAWAIEKMCEDHLYLALMATRWLDDANFAKGSRPILQIPANAAPPDRPGPGSPQS
jgi:hypothetical protein